MIAHQVPETLRQDELSHYLRRAWPLMPGHVLRELLKKRDVRINGQKAGKGDALRGGDRLEIYSSAACFAPEAELLFEDAHLIAAVKPQGLPSLPDQDGVGADTMEMRLKRHAASARLCHRLDSATGGVMLAALDDETEAQAFAAFKEHGLQKTYRALIHGRPEGLKQGEAIYRAYLLKDARQATVRVVKCAQPGAKEIVTRARVLSVAGDGLFFAELEPVTGRTHQLRAHMAALGCPILGDDKYGDRELNRRAGFVSRLCLWCETIEINGDSPLLAYRGERFTAVCPDWMAK